jgi:hypothetical protein
MPKSAATWRIGFSRFSASATASALNSAGYTAVLCLSFPSFSPLLLLYFPLIFVPARWGKVHILLPALPIERILRKR